MKVPSTTRRSPPVANRNSRRLPLALNQWVPFGTAVSSRTPDTPSLQKVREYPLFPCSFVRSFVSSSIHRILLPCLPSQ